MANVMLLSMLTLWPFLEHFVLIDLGTGYPDVNILRALICILLMIVFVKIISNNIELKFNIFLKFFIYFSLYMFFSSIILYNGNINQLQHLLDIYIFPSFAYFILLNLKDCKYKNLKKNVVLSILLSGVLISILGIAETTYGNNIFGTTPGKCWVEWGYYRSSGPFNDGITYAAVLLFFLPISWYAYVSQVISKKIYIFVFCVTSIASVLHLSRACWIVLMTICIILFGKNKKVLTAIVICIVSIFIYVYINPYTIQEIKSSEVFLNRFSDPTTIISRYELYISLLKRFFEHPIIGIGFNNLSLELLPHNSYLQMIVELGVFGFSLWVFFIYSALYAIYNSFDSYIEEKKDLVNLNKVIMCLFAIIFIVPNTIAAFNGYAMMFQYVVSISAIQYILSIQNDSFFKNEV